MAEVVLFHSVLGLRPGVIAAAERLRAAGHTVHTPDLYDGEVFDDLADGSRKEDTLRREASHAPPYLAPRVPKGLPRRGTEPVGGPASLAPAAPGVW